jgi:hypothetical protein
LIDIGLTKTRKNECVPQSSTHCFFLVFIEPTPIKSVLNSKYENDGELLHMRSVSIAVTVVSDF